MFLPLAPWTPGGLGLGAMGWGRATGWETRLREGHGLRNPAGKREAGHTRAGEREKRAIPGLERRRGTPAIYPAIPLAGCCG